MILFKIGVPSLVNYFTLYLLVAKTFHTVMNRPKKHERNCFPCGSPLGHLLFFFTISPGDECSFRIKLCVNLKMQLLPQIGMEENEVIADILLRSKMRINPGVCAREYNSIMQIIMECLIGPDACCTLLSGFPAGS